MSQETKSMLPEHEVEELMQYAHLMLDLDDLIKEKEQELKDLKDKRKQVSEGHFPDKFAELGLEEIKLDNGMKISVKPFFSCSIVDQATGFDWLIENGHGGVVKNDVIVPFPAGKNQPALDLMTQLTKQGLPAQRKLGVHWATLNALTREIYTGGGTLPETIFQVYQGAKTSIKKG
jgi:hypothetical protein